jgi:hypothetical protein
VAVLGVRPASLSPFSPRGTRPQAATPDRDRPRCTERVRETIVDGNGGGWRFERRDCELLAVLDGFGARSGSREYLHTVSIVARRPIARLDQNCNNSNSGRFLSIISIRFYKRSCTNQKKKKKIYFDQSRKLEEKTVAISVAKKKKVVL